MEVGTRASQISKGMSQEAVTLLSMDANGVRGASSLPAAMTMAPSSTSLDVSLVAPPAFLPVYSIPPGQVMTDEQLETLRRQISVYATICQQLVEMHKAIMAQQSTMQGLRLGQSIPFDAALHSGHKLTSRQRWTPSQTQLQILEKLFEQGNGTPSKQRIKEITMELSQHGQISETNVYNWFQNRRARTKRKQQVGGSNNGESELDTDVDSPEEKKTKTERDLSNETLGGAHGETNFQGGSISEYHQFEVQRGFLQAPQMHMQLDNSALNFKKSSINSQGYNVSEGGFLVDQKPWDVPGHMRDNKTDVVVSSASQESQGQMFTVNGSGQSLSLLPNAENYSMAQ